MAATLQQSARVNRSRTKKNPHRTDRIAGLLALLTILTAWFIGSRNAKSGIEPYLQQTIPEAASFEAVGNDIYVAQGVAEDGSGILGYVAVGTATGYAGPLDLAVAVNSAGDIIGVTVVNHTETPSFYDRVMRNEFVETLLGKNFRDSFSNGEDIDVVSGATYTSVAMADATRQASRAIAESQLGEAIPDEAPLPLMFGIPEIVVLLLFAVGLIAARPKFKYKKIARWVSMVTGLVLLGFVFNLPLSLSKINSFLLGFFPVWQTSLYWYLLLGGILLLIVFNSRNPYCDWFCPFGAAQECMGLVGGAKPRTPRKWRKLLLWAQRILAWLAIILALLFRNPGISNYEVFGTLFSFTGSTLSFVLLGLVLVSSMFIRRPWCNFLCPLRPVIDFTRMMRTWIVETWQIKIKNRA